MQTLFILDMLLFAIFLIAINCFFYFVTFKNGPKKPLHKILNSSLFLSIDILVLFILTEIK